MVPTVVNTVEELTIFIKSTVSNNPQWPSDTTIPSKLDVTSLIPKDTYRLTVRDALDSDGMNIVPFSNTTFNVDYAGFISDLTPPYTAACDSQRE